MASFGLGDESLAEGKQVERLRAQCRNVHLVGIKEISVPSRYHWFVICFFICDFKIYWIYAIITFI